MTFKEEGHMAKHTEADEALREINEAARLRSVLCRIGHGEVREVFERDDDGKTIDSGMRAMTRAEMQALAQNAIQLSLRTIDAPAEDEPTEEPLEEGDESYKLRGLLREVIRGHAHSVLAMAATNIFDGREHTVEELANRIVNASFVRRLVDDVVHAARGRTKLYPRQKDGYVVAYEAKGGPEYVRFGGEWFKVEKWVKVDADLLEPEEGK